MKFGEGLREPLLLDQDLAAQQRVERVVQLLALAADEHQTAGVAHAVEAARVDVEGDEVDRRAARPRAGGRSRPRRDPGATPSVFSPSVTTSRWRRVRPVPSSARLAAIIAWPIGVPPSAIESGDGRGGALAIGRAHRR